MEPAQALGLGECADASLPLSVPLLRETELDRTTYPEFRDTILSHDASLGGEPRAYPGYPRTPLPRVRPRRAFASLDRALLGRRSPRVLSRELPGARELARLLALAHGITGALGRGPAPSAGGLQALELYVVPLDPQPGAWIGTGVYHYDRAGHHLSRVLETSSRARWEHLVPSLGTLEGGAVLILIVGDARRVEARYGDRAARFLLLEAGHLMQNVCLLSVMSGLATVPLGGVLEREISAELPLPPSDAVLYVGVCGAGTRS